VTWDPALRRRPNRHWRRWGHARVVAAVERVARARIQDRPGAPRLVIGDISRPRGGDFGARWGLPGHASHQSGLDVDVYYPRRDGLLEPPETPAQVDREEAQRLVDAFLAEDAALVFTGPSLGLRGPAGRVQALAHHDNHLHVRFPDPGPGVRDPSTATG
jgi:murein endopeptidase